MFNVILNERSFDLKVFQNTHQFVNKCHYFLTVGREFILRCCDNLFCLESYQPQVTAQVEMVGAGDQLMMSYEIVAG